MMPLAFEAARERAARRRSTADAESASPGVPSSVVDAVTTASSGRGGAGAPPKRRAKYARRAWYLTTTRAYAT